MNRRQAQELQGVLSNRFPDGRVFVTEQDDGARVEVEVNGESHKFSIDNEPSVLVNHLLTGRAD